MAPLYPGLASEWPPVTGPGFVEMNSAAVAVPVPFLDAIFPAFQQLERFLKVYDDLPAG